jgi:rhomboid protease GluP
LLTYNFEHSGFIHIGFNMWCLWDLGNLAERIFDRWVYFLVYICCGVGAGLAATFFSYGNVTVGASGAIFGIAGALISALYLGHLPVSQQAIRGTVKSLVLFAGYNLAFGFIVPQISNSAHIGGLVTGLALGAVMAPSLILPSGKRTAWAFLAIAACSLILLGVFVFMRNMDVTIVG